MIYDLLLNFMVDADDETIDKNVKKTKEQTIKTFESIFKEMAKEGLVSSVAKSLLEKMRTDIFEDFDEMANNLKKKILNLSEK